MSACSLSDKDANQQSSVWLVRWMASERSYTFSEIYSFTSKMRPTVAVKKQSVRKDARTGDGRSPCHLHRRQGLAVFMKPAGYSIEIGA